LVDSSAPFLTKASTTDWDKSVETMQKSMSDHWLNEFLHMCKSMCWKEVLIIVHCYNRKKVVALQKPA